jgi:nucleotidyltransferase AbiEii toxin of type IV toxin-antitoxin system
MPERLLLRADPLVVSPLHVRILEAVADAEREYGSLDLRLEGGTALSAYYLSHRQSEDLDLFGALRMDAADFRTFVETRLTADGLHVVGRGPASRGFAEFLVADQPEAVPALGRQNIKVQFGRTSPFHLSPPLPTHEGMQVASYRDVCAGKLHAICDRYEPRDFLDLHFILERHREGEAVPDETERRRRLRALIADLEASDPGLTAVLVGQALARGSKQPIISGFPLRLLVPLEEEDVQNTIRIALDECVQLTRKRARWDAE